MVSLPKWLPFACRGAKNLAVVAVVAAAFGPSVSACADNTVFNLYTSLDSSGFRRRDTFYTDTQNIFCVAQYVATRNDITINGLVRFIRDENRQPQDSVLGVYEAAPGISRGKISITLTPPQNPQSSTGVEPFPVGTYRCEWYVDSLPPKGTIKALTGNPPPCPAGATCGADWQIVYPDCPVDYAHASYRCGGFYKVGSQCRGATVAEICTCNGAGPADVWTCQ